MTKQAIQNRLAELKQQHSQAIANANAISGAIQDCEYWLKQLDAPVLELVPAQAEGE